MAEPIKTEILSLRLPWWKELLLPCSTRGEVFEDGSALLESRWRYWHPYAWFLIVRGALGFGPRYELAVAETHAEEAN